MEEERSCFELVVASRLPRTFVDVQGLSLCNCIRDVFYLHDLNLKSPLPTKKAINSYPFPQRLATSRTDHALRCLLKTRHMEIVPTASGEHRSIRVTNLAFLVLKLYLFPLHVESYQMEGIPRLTASQFSK